MDRFFITTPIYYVNARPHLGHAYATIVADSLRRFHQAMGHGARLLTGTDEHGDKIVQAAEKAGQSPQEFADSISVLFSDLWPKLGVSPDHFVRTSSVEHKRVVQAFLQKVFDQGDIYFGEYGGHYCFGCERFYTEKELVDGVCPDHKTKPEYISEKNYFFRMSKYQGWLYDYVKSNPGFIRPERYRNEVLALLECGALEDLCISRPKSRLTWGVELPFDENYVTYVWFDALLSYVSPLGWPDGEEFKTFWPVAEHLIGKDILKPHAIFWPCMLKSAGLEPYQRLNVHGHWLIKDMKMSKSLGNVVEPLDMAGTYGVSAFRYFLLREMSFGSDASFSEEAVVGRLNADLANDLGNLFSRVLAMTHKYFGGEVPAPSMAGPEDAEIMALGRQALENYQQLFGRLGFSRALESLWELVRALNKYVDQTAPWTLFKEKNLPRLATVIYTLLEEMRRVAVHLWPVMPETAERMLEQLGQPAPTFQAAPAGACAGGTRLTDELGQWGGLRAGTRVAASSNLFPRVELSKEDAAEPAKGKSQASAAKGKTASCAGAKAEAGSRGEAKSAVSAAPAEEGGLIEFADFQKVDLRVGVVRSAEPVKGADKLLLLGVDLGEERPRQIVSGIAEFFGPAELLDRQVVVVANLKPRKLRGVESQGMILAVKREEGLLLLSPGGQAAPGDKVS